MVKANYGSGKTHLLKFIKEEALEKNYAVSLVTIDSNSGVRFNRMDQIMGAVCRNIQINSEKNEKGLAPLFNLFATNFKNDKLTNSYFNKISNYGKWDYSEILDSKAMFIALRAWTTGLQSAQDTIIDWFYNPSNYRESRKHLYQSLVLELRSYFHDPRPEWKFYDDNVFVTNKNGYEQSWAVLRDINTLCKQSGLRGFIILFDEFEDVITNLNNVRYQEGAFWNLFHFYEGKMFQGNTFFAVTPDFVNKCKRKLHIKERWDFDYARFDKLPMYEMSPLQLLELEELSLLIFDVHSIAYEWEPDTIMLDSYFKSVIKKAAEVPVQDRVRNVIIRVVEELDNLYQELH